VQAGRNPGTGNPDRKPADGARELR
jgi:hypothetical protein